MEPKTNNQEVAAIFAGDQERKGFMQDGMTLPLLNAVQSIQVWAETSRLEFMALETNYGINQN